MQGQRMGAVAAVNDQTITDAQQRDLEARRLQGGTVALLKRDNSKIVEPEQAVHPSTRESDSVQLPNEVAQPSRAKGVQPSGQPANGQPIFETIPTVIEPLPDNQQPPNAGGQPTGEPANAQPSTQPQVQPEQNVIPPLPDNQQPPNANPPSGQQSTPPNSNQQSQPEGGVIPPLPDNQQPPNAGSPQQKPPQQK
jgi:hypothetical protein